MKQKFQLILAVMVIGIVMATIFIMKQVTDNSATGKKNKQLIPGKLSITEQHDFIATRIRIMSAHPAYIGEPLEYTNTEGKQNVFAGSFSNNVFIGSHSFIHSFIHSFNK